MMRRLWRLPNRLILSPTRTPRLAPNSFLLYSGSGCPPGSKKFRAIEIVVPVKPIHRTVQSPGLFGGKRVDHLRQRGGRGRDGRFAGQSDLIVADLIQGALPGTGATPLGSCVALLGLGPGRTLIPDADHEPKGEHRVQDPRHTGAHPGSTMHIHLAKRRNGRTMGGDHNTSAPSTNMSETKKLTCNRRYTDEMLTSKLTSFWSGETTGTPSIRRGKTNLAPTASSLGAK